MENEPIQKHSPRERRIEISANGAERIINKATQVVEFER